MFPDAQDIQPLRARSRSKTDAATRRTHMVKTLDEVLTMEEILDFLKAQADARASAELEAGVLYAAREFIINELELSQGDQT
jgi:hypothetical protein